MLGMFEDALESMGFYILAGGSIAMILIGWIISKRAMEYSFPIWQLLLFILGAIIASAFFATKD